MLSLSEYEQELEDVIKDETSGDFTEALLAMLKANKDESTEVNMALAKKDAEVRILTKAKMLSDFSTMSIVLCQKLIGSC